jgi:hypothetical protein
MGEIGANSTGTVTARPQILCGQGIVNTGKAMFDLVKTVVQIADEGFFIGERDGPGGTHPGAGAAFRKTPRETFHPDLPGRSVKRQDIAFAMLDARLAASAPLRHDNRLYQGCRLRDLLPHVASDPLLSSPLYLAEQSTILPSSLPNARHFISIL